MAVPMIVRPGFSMSCETIWISRSGKTEVWEHIQMKQWDVWNAPPTRECRVTHLL